MFPDFAIYPPEFNAARLHTGPGPGSMLAAARNWSQLASDLGAATENIGAVLEALTEVWQGPAAIRMAEAVLSYRAWLVEVSNLAEATAKLTRRTARAYQTAHFSMVPSAVIADNVAKRAWLIQTNLLGNNAPAIAALDAKYMLYWTQNARAMNVYADDTMDEMSLLTPFAEAPQITNELGLAQGPNEGGHA
ncbi:PPE family protein [Mycobacterium haemophilum]